MIVTIMIRNYLPLRMFCIICFVYLRVLTFQYSFNEVYELFLNRLLGKLVYSVKKTKHFYKLEITNISIQSIKYFQQLFFNQKVINPTIFMVFSNNLAF